MMGTAINLFICLVAAGATISVLVLETYERRYLKRWSSYNPAQALSRIIDTAEQLLILPPNQRGPVRRAIARDILFDITYVHYLVSEYYRHGTTEDAEVRERALAVALEIKKLFWEVRKSQFVFYFHPKAMADCQRIVHALEGHYRVWTAYIRLMQAKYPDLYGNISIQDAP